MKNDDAETKGMEHRFPPMNYDNLAMVSDLADQLIDLMLNYRQSGHPGGSRSKIRILTTLFLGGGMRYDIRDPKDRMNDRFVLAAGHTIPSIYALLAVLYECMRARKEATGDSRYDFKEKYALLCADLIKFRRRGGKVPGHAETITGMISTNTGPSGHGFPIAAGLAVALDHADCPARVWVLEGEGGFTPGVTHETQNAAWAARLGHKLFVLEDYNDATIDRRACEVIPSCPRLQWEAHNWIVEETPLGMDFLEIHGVLRRMMADESDLPKIGIFHTIKGRGYGIEGPTSHGTPHPMNSPEFWATKREFQDRWGVTFAGFGQAMDPKDQEAQQEQYAQNLQVIVQALRSKPQLVEWVSDILLALADSVPKDAPLTIDTATDPWQDPRLRLENLPAELFVAPGTKIANRNALGVFGRYINEVTKGRLISFAADLSGSLNIRPMNADYGIYGSCNRQGTEFPAEITEFFNAGCSAGIASVNFSADPENSFAGYYALHGTYGSFVYLGYGPMRLFSQLSQDSPIRTGKVIFLAGHTGPETADDSRTHFGVFSPGVIQLFPQGHVINIVPWEYNEVPVMLAAALAAKAPIIGLHLTRPAIVIPDRQALGIASHREAAKGAYVLRPYDPDRPQMGTVLVQGTSTTDTVVRLLPRIDQAGLNVKILAAVSWDLFQLQDEKYRQSLFSPADRINSMFVTNVSARLMQDWACPYTLPYCLHADKDNRWRTGGTIDEVLEEAGLSPDHIFAGIEAFAKSHKARRAELKALLGETESTVTSPA